MHWDLALQNQCLPCSVLRCPHVHSTVSLLHYSPRSSKLCASGLCCHLGWEPCLAAVHLLRVRNTDYTLLKMQRSLGAWGWAWRRAPPLELGYLAVFSEWGGQETVRAGLSFSLFLSPCLPHQTQSSQPSNAFKTRLHCVPSCWWGFQAGPTSWSP